uniref:UDP-N-acetylglucosamine 1-carboxyvinyltransferase n=1 Tax=candidate division WOR-3 bacterium TaxID=2052148 RepID=A0A7C1NQF3_UNCW3
MDRFKIRGGRPLRGEVRVARAKNAVLPLLAAALLSEDTCVIDDVPFLDDVVTMLKLLESIGVKVEMKDRTIKISAAGRLNPEAPYDIVRKMRASYYVLGPLLARFGDCRVSLPGGCAIGPRPVDLHLKGITALGARVKIEKGYIHARARSLRGNTMMLEGQKGPSVGATINTMMAAVLARGETVIEGAACEPEVVDVAQFLSKMGADINGAGTPTITVRGVKELRGARHTPIPDRIEAGTFAVAAAITRGRVEIIGCEPRHLTAVITKLQESGIRVEAGADRLLVEARSRPQAVKISTAPYPGFPTDLQAQFTALLSIAQGTSTVTENIFESRFLHCLELNRMGALIDITGNMAVIHGVEQLEGAQVMASDLRASAALVLAGLAARGQTEILRIYHLDRGYERLENKLKPLGADIRRVSS